MALSRAITGWDMANIITTSPYPYNINNITTGLLESVVSSGPARKVDGEWIYDSGTGLRCVIAPASDTQTQAQAKLTAWLTP